jgi:hypothetical protein
MKNSLSKVLLIAALTSSCNMEPQLGELVADMVVQTKYNESSVNSNFNIFTTYSTFILREDTIGFVSSSSSDTILVDGVNITVAGGYVTPVVNRVLLHLTDAGFVKVKEDENPDFAVNIAVLQNFNVFQTINYPGFYPGYYGYWGYYYPIVSTYYANYATMIIEIVDMRNYSLNGNGYKVIWKASIGDLISTLDLRTKTLEAINQAFLQSPYVNKAGI